MFLGFLYLVPMPDEPRLYSVGVLVGVLERRRPGKRFSGDRDLGHMYCCSERLLGKRDVMYDVFKAASKTGQELQRPSR